MTHTMTLPQLDDQQIDTILNQLVPLIAAPGEEEAIRAMLRLCAEEYPSHQFAALVQKILDSHAA